MNGSSQPDAPLVPAIYTDGLARLFTSSLTQERANRLPPSATAYTHTILTLVEAEVIFGSVCYHHTPCNVTITVFGDVSRRIEEPQRC